MRITKISVEGLFGMFDHEIPLNQESRITIVHGPNGVGKTVLLNLVHGLFHYEYEFIGRTPFDELRLEFADGAFIAVRKNDRLQDDDKYSTLIVDFEDCTGKDHIAFEPTTQHHHHLHEFIMEEDPEFRMAYVMFSRRQNVYWIKEDIHTLQDMRAYTPQEMLVKYPSLHTDVYGEIPDWFASIQNAANTHLILTDRLQLETMGYEMYATNSLTTMNQRRDEPDKPQYFFPSPRNTLDRLAAIEKFPRGDLGSGLWERVSRNLDQFIIELDDLIEKIKAHMNRTTLLVEEIEDRTGWSIAENWNDFDCGGLDLQDLHKLREIAPSFRLFLDIINERLLFKIVTPCEKDGINVTADDGSAVPLDTLSSGEQHVIVLYYKLLFEIEPDTLVMIDEPELSMNVVWQRNFLKDLQRIIELRKFDVLIATHSPMIIHDKWDWVVHLGEKVDD